MRAIIWNWHKVDSYILGYGSVEDRSALMYGAADARLFDAYDIAADTLEEVFFKLNMEHPKDYKLRSLSVGDLLIDNNDEVWFCASAGWKKLTDICPPGLSAGIHEIIAAP